MIGQSRRIRLYGLVNARRYHSTLNHTQSVVENSSGLCGEMSQDGGDLGSGCGISFINRTAYKVV